MCIKYSFSFVPEIDEDEIAILPCVEKLESYLSPSHCLSVGPSGDVTQVSHNKM